MDNIYIILNMNKMIMNNDGLYDIIPCKASLTIIYKNNIIYNNTHNIKYNLYEYMSDNIKFNNAITYLNNKNIFPTKEHKGKRVIRYNSKIGIESETFRNFIKSLIFILKNYININPILVSSHNSNTMWILNKIINNRSTTTINYINTSTIIIDNINISNDCEIINDFCANYIIDNKFDNNLQSQSQSNIIDTILEYISMIFDHNLHTI
ncbi:unknown similar to AMEV085 [Choristoneura biennis entomopoxvirus]|uniref:Uncharacterized protein n=1 Tax=Choristoneura biennis entomopoxvirus TaxID=10288 RepID=A0A916P6S2_CBEPV|nr:unknown similar to AMEV085 [Choristoneura biennis entomopoxvirus]CCU55710.1 unknown similar to AMEV085 [Choristoneura biennis entomopoxvirus]